MPVTVASDQLSSEKLRREQHKQHQNRQKAMLAPENLAICTLQHSKPRESLSVLLSHGVPETPPLVFGLLRDEVRTQGLWRFLATGL